MIESYLIDVVEASRSRRTSHHPRQRRERKHRHMTIESWYGFVDNVAAWLRATQDCGDWENRVCASCRRANEDWAL